MQKYKTVYPYSLIDCDRLSYADDRNSKRTAKSYVVDTAGYLATLSGWC